MSRYTRRDVLRGLGAAALAAGCGREVVGGAPRRDAGPYPPDRDGAPAPAPGDASPPEPIPPPDRCEQTTTLAPEELLAPIDTFVVLCMENRSFDHYLGWLTLGEGRDLDGLTGSETNPAPDGTPVGVFRLDDFTPADPPHSWSACHEQWNAGANDGFVRVHAGPDQAQVMGYHVREQLAATYPLADEFAVCDRWFCSLLGPTWPNRFYLHGGTARGTQSNVPIVGFDSVFEQLDGAGISSRNYFHDLAWASGGYFKLNGLAGIERFFDDAAAGTLPAFSIIDPKFVDPGANDDHPSHDIQLGQALIASVYAALAASPQWDRCLFVVTYDEHGGFYDHVGPPTTIDPEPGFEQLGFRVPAIVAGPYVRPRCTVRATLEHTSVVSTATRRFGLAPLHARVAATTDLSVCISPSLVMRRAPRRPPRLPPLAVPALRPPSTSRAHDELSDLADRGEIPRHLDRRADGERIARHVLERGVRLGALR